MDMPIKKSQQTTRVEKFTSTHWGTYKATIDNGSLVALRGVDSDDDPAPFSASMLDTLDAPNRIKQPMVRKSFLERRENSDRSKRGVEPFVAVSWDTAEQLVADELARIRNQHGNEAIFAGCYGWASAGRFHHAQSQIHRFLNMFGGYVDSKNTYSFSAAEVILPHVIGDMWSFMMGDTTSWPSIIDHSQLMVCFGGLSLKNGQVANGGTGRHVQAEYMRAARAKGVEFAYIGPIRDDMGDFLDAQWLAAVPGSDVAIMLALTHTLVVENLYDSAFLDKYCVGFDRFKPYVLGDIDGQPKDAEWAAKICGLEAEALRGLARRMARARTMISVSWSLTRQHHGEHNYWMATVLAAMLGQIGLPGGGIGYGYGAENAIGNHTGHLRWAALEQGVNKVETFIPTVRIADMLLNPGTPFDYDGGRYHYPDIRMVYWVGGNPFHHHQDLNRLRRAWQKPETIIVHEPWWNGIAKHSDIVLPCTTTLERNDLSCNPLDGHAYPMEKVVEPFADARNDYDIFSGVARRLGFADEFTQGRDEAAWLRDMWATSKRRAEQAGIELPEFEDFWEHGFELAAPAEPIVFCSKFRSDPDANPLPTPSGKIEIYSEDIASYDYDDCPAHPTWMEPAEYLNSEKTKTYPLHLLSNQPKTRLHSQLDHGAYSKQHKIQDREPVTLNPDDAAARGIKDGDVVRIFSARGACLAGAIISDALRPGVIQISTGAWYDPEDPAASNSLCKHGNVNVLTLDMGTSKLAQGCSAHTCLVDVERFEGIPPKVTAHDPPEIIYPDE